MSAIRDAAVRILQAPNGGALIAATIDAGREFGLPEVNRQHLSGIAKRYAKSENARRRVWIALCECLAEDIVQRDAGGIGSVSQYVDRVISMSGVAPAARNGISRSPAVDDALAGLKKLGWNVTIAEQLVLAAAARGDVDENDADALFAAAIAAGDGEFTP